MKQLIFNLPDELAQKFELAIELTGANRDVVAEEFVRGYLANALQSAANQYKTPEPVQPAPVQSPFRQSAPPVPPVQTTPPPVQTPRNAVPPEPETGSIFQEWGKAIKRIPRWARNPQQNNHKILRAFFQLKHELGNVTLDALRRRCSDPIGHPNTYVPHFDNNFSQMKFDNGNSHGKVFEEHDGYVTIWDRLTDTIQRYRDYFE